MSIPYGRQCIEDDDIQAVIDVLQADYLTTGPKIEEFEQAVAAYVNVQYAVAVSNGTAALHAACFAAGIKAGDEVITTPITFAASANCIMYCGGTPVFADIDPDTYNIDPKAIEQKITSRTKAVIPVHFAGQPCDMDEIHKIAEKYSLTVIEDGAHALGARYKGKKIGGLSDMTIFSFHPVKPITTGEGGMIVTNDRHLYQRLLFFRSHGIVKDPAFLQQYEGPWYYEQQFLGYNYRITDIQCALGLSQMKKIDRFLEKRREAARKYDEAFRDCKDLILPYQMEGADSGWHLYTIQVLHHDRRTFFEYLKEKGIDVNVHYIPVYRHPYYRSRGFRSCSCPNAEAYYSRAVSLPIFPSLTEGEQQYIIEQIWTAVSSRRL